MNKIDILVIDDMQRKTEKIITVLKKSEYEIEQDVAINIVQAKKMLMDKSYDLVILDIQLPHRTGDNINKNGGIELLRSLNNGRLLHPTHIIGLSAYQESIDESLMEFSEKSLILINYDETSNAWEKQLLEKVNQIGKTNVSKEREETMKYNYDIAILCALFDPELKSVLDLDCNWKKLDVPDDSTSDYYKGTFQKNGEEIKLVATYSPQMGMPASSLMATKLIDRFKPKYLVMTGISAGVKGKVNLGDIIVADNCWDYDSGKKIVEDNGLTKLIPDYKPLRLDPILSNSAKRFSTQSGVLADIKNKWRGPSPSTSLEVHVGDLASGGSVVANSDVIQDLQQHARKILGVEMEAYGVYLAAYFGRQPSPKAIVIKSVCDFADQSKNDDYQTYAAYTSANFFYQLAKNEWNYQ